MSRGVTPRAFSPETRLDSEAPLWTVRNCLPFSSSTLTSLTLASVNPEHVDILAEALATNTTLVELRMEAPNKGGAPSVAKLPVQEINGHKGTSRIDLWEAGEGNAMHRQACAVVGALMNVNTSVSFLRVNPGGSSPCGR